MTRIRQGSIEFNSLTEGDLLSKKGDTLLILWLAKNKLLDQVPKNAITKKVLLEIPKTRGYDKKSAVIHYLAKNEEFKHIPKEILTEELLSTTGLDRNSVYHTLAAQAKLDLLPKRLLTHKALTLKSHSDWTPLHSIAHHTPHLMPENITMNDVLLKSRKNITVLHSWSCGAGWVDIPRKFLTKESLQLKDPGKQTPFLHIVNQFEYDSSYRKRFVGKDTISQLKYVLSQTSTKQLKEIANNPGDYKKLSPFVKEELLKRTIVKKLSSQKQQEQSIEI